MADSSTTYRRLPGRGTSLASYIRLYLGPDHLLQVASTGYSETYKRFYFRDIQAIVVQRTSLWQVLNWVFGALSVPCLVLWVFSFLYPANSDVGAWKALVSMFAVLLTPVSIVPLIVNLILGPTCHCQIRTAVQVERLSTLRRLRTARKVLARIKPLIEAEQGRVSPQELEQGSPGPGSTGDSAGSDAPPVIGRVTPAAPPAPALRDFDGRMHLILSWLLLADLPATAITLLNTAWAHSVSMVLFATTCISAVLALVKQRGTNVPIRLRRLPWIVLAVYAIYQLAAVIYGVYLGISGARRGGLLGLAVLDDPVLITLAFVSTAISVCLGCLGLLALRQSHSSRSSSPPPLAEPSLPAEILPPPA